MVTPAFVGHTEAAAGGRGAVVWTVSVELPLPVATVAGEKVQVVFTGGGKQERATGKLNLVPGMTVTV
jgi:hypothetical protein